MWQLRSIIVLCGYSVFTMFFFNSNSMLLLKYIVYYLKIHRNYQTRMINTWHTEDFFQCLLKSFSHFIQAILISDACWNIRCILDVVLPKHFENESVMPLAKMFKYDSLFMIHVENQFNVMHTSWKAPNTFSWSSNALNNVTCQNSSRHSSPRILKEGFVFV